jgi:futalosine hydrolase
LCRGFHQYGFGYCEEGQIRSYAQTVVASLIDADDYQPATLIPQSPAGEMLQVVDCLSVFSASGDAEEAEHRREWFDMDIEEMEGYAAALACRQMNVPFGAIRGITNQAGDRDHSNWKMDEAAHAIRDALAALFAQVRQA